MHWILRDRIPNDIRACIRLAPFVRRRLRAMPENVKESLPKDRWPPLTAQFQFLDAAVKRKFPDARDRALAGAGDYQGIGGDAEGAALSQPEQAGMQGAR